MPPRALASSSVRSPTRRSTSWRASTLSALRALGEPLQVGLDGLQRARVDQLAQLLLAEQLAQQLAVQRERGGASLGVGLVALVHVRGDVVEQQAATRTARRSASRPRPGSARAGAAWSAGRAGRGGPGRRGGPRGRSPGRSGTARSGARPPAATATSGAAATAACAGPGRRAGSAARGRRSRGSGRRTARSRRARPRQVLELVGVDQHQLLAGRLVGVGEVDDDAVVGPDRVRLQAVLLADAGGQRERPTRRARGRRTGSARTPASRRSRRGSARRRSCGRDGMTRVASCCSRRNSTRLLAAFSSRS